MKHQQKCKWWKDPEAWVVFVALVIGAFLTFATGGEYLWPWLGAL